MPHTITPSPTSRNTSRSRAQALCLFALAAALLCVDQKAACAQEPPSPGKKRGCELLGPAFTFSSNHKKHFDVRSHRMAKIRRRWHADQLQEDGVNRDGSVWWYSIFVQNYQEWYLNNQTLAHLTVGETIKAKRQQQERDRAALLPQAGSNSNNPEGPGPASVPIPENQVTQNGQQKYTPEPKSCIIN